MLETQRVFSSIDLERSPVNIHYFTGRFEAKGIPPVKTSMEIRNATTSLPHDLSEPARLMHMIDWANARDNMLGYFFRAYNTLFGDYLDGEFALEEANINKDPEAVIEARTSAARFNQKLAQEIYSIGDLSRLDPRVGELELFLRISKDLGSISRQSMGAFAQAAIMTSLRDTGYLVMVPDPENAKEIQNWDLKGVDLTAIAQDGSLYYIDAKSKKEDESIGYQIKKYEQWIHGAIRGDVCNYLKQAQENSIIPFSLRKNVKQFFEKNENGLAPLSITLPLFDGSSTSKDGLEVLKQLTFHASSIDQMLKLHSKDKLDESFNPYKATTKARKLWFKKKGVLGKKIKV